MLDLANAPALFFAPFVSSTMRVEPQWIDHNRHLNMAYYNVLMDRAIDELFALIGLGPAYVAERGGTTFTAECHVMYRRELTVGEPVRTTIQLIDFDDKRLHTFEELRHANEGWLSASSENVSLHVDVATRKVAPFPADIMANLALLKAAHMKLALPELSRPRHGHSPPQRRQVRGAQRARQKLGALPSTLPLRGRVGENAPAFEPGWGDSSGWILSPPHPDRASLRSLRSTLPLKGRVAPSAAHGPGRARRRAAADPRRVDLLAHALVVELPLKILVLLLDLQLLRQIAVDVLRLPLRPRLLGAAASRPARARSWRRRAPS